MAATLSESERDRAAHIVALFSALLHARLTSNFRKAANTDEELEARGVKVRFLTEADGDRKAVTRA